MTSSEQLNKKAGNSMRETYESFEEVPISPSSPEDTARTGRRSSRKNWTWAQVIGGTGISFAHVILGTTIGFPGTTVPEMMNPPKNETLTLSENEAMFFVSAFFFGCLPGSLAAGPILSYFGQKKALLVGLPLQTFSWVLLSRANKFELLVLCRVIQGFLHSTNESASLTYVAEVCQPHIRGKMLSLADLGRQAGYVVIFLLGSSWLGWRKIALICGLTIPVIPFVTALFLPASPRWLASKNKNVQSESSLIFFRKGVRRSTVQQEFNHIVEQLEETAGRLSLLNQIKLLKHKSLARIFSLRLATEFLIHFTGCSVIQTYPVIIFTAVTEQVNAYLITVLVGCAKFVGALLFFALSDRYGRCPLFMISLVVNSVSVGILGTYFAYRNVLQNYKIFDWILVISIFLDFVCYALFVGVNAALRVELHPTEFRSFAVGMNLFSTFVGYIAAIMTFFTLTKAIGYVGVFWLYSITGVVLALLIWAFVPETRGRTLEEINVLRSNR